MKKARLENTKTELSQQKKKENIFFIF